MNSASRSGKRSIQSATTGSSRGNKSLRWTSDDAPSPSASNDNGYRLFHERVQSFLCHPLGLPLVAAFHRQVLLPVESLTYPVAAFPEAIGTTDTTGDDILSNSYTKGMKEPELTQALQENIGKKFQDEFAVTNKKTRHNFGRADLAVFSKKDKDGNSVEKSDSNESTPDTPLCVVELGMNSADWWLNFDQGFQYIEMMRGQTEGRICFQKPLLLVIITLNDKNKNKDVFDFRMGVFLCTPKNDNDFRMSLIWHKQDVVLDDASKSFGLLLRILPHFHTKRDRLQSNDNPIDFKYFSSNCCKVGDMVCNAVVGLHIYVLVLVW